MSAERHHESAERHEALNHLEATRAEKLAELRRSPETEPGDAAATQAAFQPAGQLSAHPGQPPAFTHSGQPHL
jgi:hypothetical protein